MVDVGFGSAGFFLQPVDSGFGDVTETILDIQHHLDNKFGVAVPFFDKGIQFRCLSFTLDGNFFRRHSFSGFALADTPGRRDIPVFYNQGF